MIVDPKKLSMKELEHLTRRFFTEIEVLIGPERDIPAPDVNTTPQIMAWFMDTYSMHAGYTVPGVVTGKPISLGGSEGRNEATARGCVFTIVEAAKHLGMDLTKSTVAVQGFGNAGSIAAQLMSDEGSTVVAVSDTGGGDPQPGRPRHPAGPRLEEGARHRRRLPGRKTITNGELLELECDILIPAAFENQITAANADTHQGQDRRRGRQRPHDARGRRDPLEEGRVHDPRHPCNAGGVTVSYFEWVQDLNRDHWTEADVNAKLKVIMDKAFGEVLAQAEKNGVQHAHRRLPQRRPARRRRHRHARPLSVIRRDG